jgi:hypothetical protein
MLYGNNKAGGTLLSKKITSQQSSKHRKSNFRYSVARANKGKPPYMTLEVLCFNLSENFSSMTFYVLYFRSNGCGTTH